MVKQLLNVDGMTCEHCAAKVKRAAEGVPGVLRAEVDLTEGEVHLTLESDDVSGDAIKEAIEKAGYQVVD